MDTCSSFMRYRQMNINYLFINNITKIVFVIKPFISPKKYQKLHFEAKNPFFWHQFLCIWIKILQFGPSPSLLLLSRISNIYIYKKCGFYHMNRIFRNWIMSMSNKGKHGHNRVENIQARDRSTKYECLFKQEEMLIIRGQVDCGSTSSRF